MTELQPYPKFDDTQSCYGVETDLMYKDSEDLEGYSDWERKQLYTALKKICDNCYFVAECYNWALHHEAYGIWGGTTARQRGDERKRRGIKLIDPVSRAYGKDK